MYQGSLAPVTNREDWIFVSPLIDEDGEEVTLTGATINVWFCKQGCPDTAVLGGSTDDGKITLPSPTTFQWHFTPDDVGGICAGTYDVFLRVIIDDITTQILCGTQQVKEGGPSV